MSTPDQLSNRTLIKVLSLKFERLPALLSRSLKLDLVPALFSRPRRNFSGPVVLFLIMSAIVVPLAYYFIVRPSDPSMHFSAAPKLASINSQPIELPPPPLPRNEAVPIAAEGSARPAGSLNAIKPASFGNTAFPEIKAQESVPPVIFATETTPAPQSTPSSDLSKFASMGSPPVTALPLTLPPNDAVPPAAQRSTPPPGSVNETTAALSQSTPPSEMKTTVPKTDAMRRPRANDSAGRQHAQKESKLGAARSCTADIFSENVRASSRTKIDQLGVHRICADPGLPAMGYLRCFVASIVCPDWPF
jgi:hypothetical protein